MKAKFIAFFLFVMLAVLPVAAQGRPGGGGQHQVPQGHQGQSQRGSEMGKGTMQRDQVRACDQFANQIRQRAHELARTAQRSGWQVEPMRALVTQLRQQFRSMQEEHNRLMQSLKPEQNIAWQERIRKMEQIREQAEAQLSSIEGELANTYPDGRCIAERAREMERLMKEWQEQYRK